MKTFIAKEQIFDRFEQSFQIFFKNFFALTLPLFLYNFLFIGVVWVLLFAFVLVKFWAGFAWFQELWNMNLSSFYDPLMMLFITIGIVFFIVYLLWNIPLVLWTLRSSHQAIYGQEVTVMKNLAWWVKSIFQSFKTYWYIFRYVYLIPAILFIVWGFCMIGFQIYNISELESIAILLIILSLVLFLSFAIYRGLKTTFSIFYAVDKQSFTDDNFNKSVKITDDNWWRIWWNFIVVWFVVGFIWSILGLIISIFIPSWFDFESLFYSFNSMWNIWDLQTIDTEFNIVNQMINNVFSSFINQATTAFIFVFSYIFMIRLEDEYVQKKENLEINNLDIEL